MTDAGKKASKSTTAAIPQKIEAGKIVEADMLDFSGGEKQ